MPLAPSSSELIFSPPTPDGRPNLATVKHRRIGILLLVLSRAASSASIEAAFLGLTACPHPNETARASIVPAYARADLPGRQFRLWCAKMVAVGHWSEGQ